MKLFLSDERSLRSTFRSLVPDAVVQKRKAHEFCLHAAVASATVSVFRVGSRLQSRFMSWFAKRLARRLRNSANSFEGSGGRPWILRARAAWILRARAGCSKGLAGDGGKILDLPRARASSSCFRRMEQQFCRWARVLGGRFGGRNVDKRMVLEPSPGVDPEEKGSDPSGSRVGPMRIP